MTQDTRPQSAAAPFQALAEQREHEAQIEQDRRETFVADIRFGLYGQIGKAASNQRTAVATTSLW